MTKPSNTQRSSAVQMSNPNVQRPIPSGMMRLTIKRGKVYKGHFKSY